MRGGFGLFKSQVNLLQVDPFNEIAWLRSTKSARWFQICAPMSLQVNGAPRICFLVEAQTGRMTGKNEPSRQKIPQEAMT